MEIAVCRGASMPGCCFEENEQCPGPDDNLKWGEDISDELLSTTDAKRERGRVEIDKSYTNRSDVGVTLKYAYFLQPASMANISHTDMDFNAKLKSGSINLSKQGGSLSISTTLSFEAAEDV